MNMNVYQGYRIDGETVVTVNNLPLKHYTDGGSIRPPDFNWGYAGSGPAQLALAIMVHEFGNDLEDHPANYHDFKFDVISVLEDSFSLTSYDITLWVKQQQFELQS